MFQLAQRIRFTDVDAIGNVNYAVYLQLVDDTFIEWWSKNVSRACRELRVVAVWMAASWKKAIEIPGPVAVTLQVMDVRTTSFELHAEVSHPDGGVAFVCRTRYVLCTHHQPTPLPLFVRQLLTSEQVTPDTANALRGMTAEREVTSSSIPHDHKDVPL